MHVKEVKEIVQCMKYGLMPLNAKIGKQRTQHHKVIKLGYIEFLETTVDMSKWSELLIDKIEEKLQEKVKLALIISRIYDSMSYYDNKIQAH